MSQIRAQWCCPGGSRCWHQHGSCCQLGPTGSGAHTAHSRHGQQHAGTCVCVGGGAVQVDGQMQHVCAFQGSVDAGWGVHKPAATACFLEVCVCVCRDVLWSLLNPVPPRTLGCLSVSTAVQIPAAVCPHRQCRRCSHPQQDPEQQQQQRHTCGQ